MLAEKIPSEVIVDSINPFNWFKIGKQIKRDSPDLLIFKYWMPFFAHVLVPFPGLQRKIKRQKYL